MPDDGNDWVGKINSRKDVGADRRVQLHFGEFSVGELTWLVEDVLRDSKFPHVVEQSCRFNSLNQPTVMDTKFTSETQGVLLDTPDVAVGNLIFRIDCHREGLDCRKIKSIQFIDMLVCVLDARHRELEGKIQYQQ